MKLVLKSLQLIERVTSQNIWHEKLKMHLSHQMHSVYLTESSELSVHMSKMNQQHNCYLIVTLISLWFLLLLFSSDCRRLADIWIQRISLLNELYITAMRTVKWMSLHLNCLERIKAFSNVKLMKVIQSDQC